MHGRMKAPTPGRSKRIPPEECYDPAVLRSLGWVGLLTALGCSRAGVQTTKLPDGTRELRCDVALWKCLLHVDDYCKGASYEVIHASDEQLVFGSQASAVEGRRSQAVLRCLKPGAKLADSPAPTADPPPPEVQRPVSAPSPPPARACVPGATQACVGAAACSGGQACLADGSGFGVCDCGTPKAPGEPVP
jgi:hypothetical protein